MVKISRSENDLFLNTYNRIPLDISYGTGVHLIAKDGQRYLDFFSGLAVTALGHSHPRIVDAVTSQINKFAHVSNFYLTEVQLKLASLLIKHSGMSKVFLTNSGTEAAESAIKLVRKIKGPEKIIYSFTNSFHGRTYGSMSLSSREKNKKYFSPLLPGLSLLNFDNTHELKSKINSETAAVFIELIQGEGGVNVISQEFVNSLITLKKQFGFLIIADEIQSGIGRTGKPFAYNHFEFMPDIVLAAKSIGGGLPLGAMLVSEELSHSFSPGDHGSTFGGNPVSCAAGIVVLEEVLENKLYEMVDKLGTYLLSELNILRKQYNNIILDVRGKGFMVGIEINSKGDFFVEKMREWNVLINCTNQNVLRILPPLISSKSDIDFFLHTFHDTLKTTS